MSESRNPVSLRGLAADDPHLQPAARRPDVVERVVALTMVLAVILFVGFLYLYTTDRPAWTLGATFGGGFFLLGIALIAWGKYLMPKGPFEEERHPLGNTKEDVDAMAAAIVERGGGVVKRRPLLGGLLGAGMATVGAATIWPLLRSMGPNPKDTLYHTDWRKGTYVVGQDGRRVHVSDLAVGSIATVFPEGTQDTERGQAVNQTVIIRVSNSDFTTMAGRQTWAPQGYVAYSKLCTHLGCPVGLYEQQLQLLVCPCHQSMFDVTNGALPNFGPAPRPLPQLPLYIDKQGYLRSQSDYKEPVGPGFWERA
jgi:ubiquinol-cytochrome c reductase iron-sulfur subunit